MIAPALLQSIQDLPVSDKLSLLELISQMLKREFVRPNNGSHSMENSPKTTTTFAKQQDIQALVTELLSRPNPPPEKILPRGLWKGLVTFTEEDFKLAEWHPSAEELAGD